ncbi:GPA1, alpha subunit of a heterotrimeric G protein [Tribonema minus]|uniref:GPA1, alpha subunit of a heterotrimeric G protein n=1 Tax=Tribonema minus TaxID=303371 RepID=A0A836CKU9_9STRA|nr:GPA1, alpha subunit of a heterotrimeric G protein [Tribonema minus]
MGGCGSSQTLDEREAWKVSKEVDQLAALDFRREQKKIRLLLLGPGESGKSTIFRQMKLLYGEITEDERKSMTPVVYANIVSTMKILIKQCHLFGYGEEIEDQTSAEMLTYCEDTAPVDAELGAAVKAVWADAAVQKTWFRRNEYQIVESMSYYLDSIDRISAPDYVADINDVLHVRIRSSGVVVDRYTIDGFTFEMYDVGGQRNERKKWIHCFDNVTAIIYVAALSEYDQGLYEDAQTNRMVEAISLFREIAHNPFFIHSSLILFLNKKDLFEAKVKVRNIADVPHFSDYGGPRSDHAAGTTYFLKKFLAHARSEDQAVYHHVTCATDTSAMQVVLISTKDTVLRQNLQQQGFI